MVKKGINPQNIDNSQIEEGHFAYKVQERVSIHNITDLCHLLLIRYSSQYIHILCLATSASE
jgi:hypothetical protein